MSKQYWWKTTFGDVYLSAFDEIYSPQQAEKEATFLIEALKMKKGSLILDLACGQGRHSIALAQHGMNVVGVDTSKQLLRTAKQRAEENKVNVSFIKDDMRIYCVPKHYDTVLILGNSFGYFNDIDNERVLSKVASSLKPCGQFVLDLSNTLGMLRRPITGKWTQKITGGKLTTQTLDFNPKTFQVSMQWQIFKNKIKTSLIGTLRLYTPPEITRLLAEHGFIIKKTYGSFSNESYNIKTKRYLVIAQKSNFEARL